MSEDQLFQISTTGLIQKIQTLADGTVRIIFDLNEDMESAKQFLDDLHKFGKITFEPDSSS